ncbi:nucleoside 2-deoxyribosyltransferase [Sulfurimonas sp. MAG313]|nr:nucleoside 2-deoxyribosyltransferase [Sulfurimonas sp. MAG313]MDF1881719.1 nucleoside 2-deoxyribosyltransferase [Sulfurimonas sp. MAG313]
MNKKKIYLAGFDVFYPDAIAVLKTKKDLCERYGFNGLTPLDNEVDFSLPKEEIRDIIYKANVKLMHEADIFCINLNAFRHGEPDSGTVFEIGYGKALGKDLYIYVDSNESMLEKTQQHDKDCKCIEGVWLDKNGLMIEDFDGMFNLMITQSSTIINGNLEMLLKHLQ